MCRWWETGEETGKETGEETGEETGKEGRAVADERGGQSVDSCYLPECQSEGPQPKADKTHVWIKCQ